MKWVAVSAIASLAIFAGAFVVAMAANEACLPWQTPQQQRTPFTNQPTGKTTCTEEKRPSPAPRERLTSLECREWAEEFGKDSPLLPQECLQLRP